MMVQNQLLLGVWAIQNSIQQQVPLPWRKILPVFRRSAQLYCQLLLERLAHCKSVE